MESEPLVDGRDDHARAQQRRLLEAHVCATEMKDRRLQEMDVFVLDNSMRETTVASVKGHVAADKDTILAELEGTGFTDIIVGAFGPLERPDDVWLKERQARGEIGANWWCFAEMYDQVVDEGSPDFMPAMSYGLSRIQKYGIQNVILEVDVSCERGAPPGFQFDRKFFSRLFQSRADYIRAQICSEAKIFINIRDGPWAFFDTTKGHHLRARMLTMVHAAAAVTPRLFGLLFEDPNAELPHWGMGTVTGHIRAAMLEDGWADGHLLVHIHKRYALADAGVLESLALGATGVWCATCEEGGGMGHASSVTTLINLHRLGNRHVARKYNLKKVYDAAVNITKISTGAVPPPRTEVYGARALDIVWPSGGTGGTDNLDLADLVGCEHDIRISPFADAKMIAAKLTKYFGPLGWEEHEAGVLDAMVRIISEDLVQGRSWEYNGPAGLFELYGRAGGCRCTTLRSKSI